jgi:hypothetical protein
MQYLESILNANERAMSFVEVLMMDEVEHRGMLMVQNG